MGDRDAFGNEKGKDSLAALGWTSGSTPVPAPAEADRASTSSPVPPYRSVVSIGGGRPDANVNEAFGAITPPPPPPSVRTVPGIPRRPSAFSGMRLIGLVLRLIVPVAVLGVIGATVFSVGSKVSDSVQDARRAISTSFDNITVPTTPTATGEGSATAPTPPAGLGKGSLLKASNFKRALTVLKAEGSRARSVRVAPDRIDAQLVTSSGFIRQVQVSWQGRRQRSSQTGPGFSQTGTFKLSGLDVNAPLRLTRSAAGRAKGTASSVDYLVAITTGLEPQGWTVILKNGKGQYLADVHGRITRRIN